MFGDSLALSLVTVVMGEPIPANALLDEDGHPILDENGDYILGE